MNVIKIKIMPNSPQANLEEIRKKAEKIIKAENLRLHSCVTEPIAFGLCSILLTVLIEEEKSPEKLVEKIEKIENVSSATIIDFRKI